MANRKATGAPAERRVFRVDQEWAMGRQKNRPFQWIEMDDGRELCVWSAMVGDAFRIMTASVRPGVFEELGPDQASALRMQIATSCYDDEPPMGQRIFSDDKLGAIDLLSTAEMNRILAASAALNGSDPETVEQLEDFVKRNGGSSSPS